MIKSLFLLCIGTFSLSATTYYVSPTGSDSVNFNSMLTPWKTLDRAANAPLKEGDLILLKRGGVWREGIYPFISGVTYGAYGSGARPIVSGATLITQGWAAAGLKLWSVNLPIEPKQVWFNGVAGEPVDSPSAVSTVNEWNYTGGVLTIYSDADPASAQIEAGQLDCVVAMDSVSNIRFQDLHLSKSNGPIVFAGVNMGGTETFSNVVWDNAQSEGLLVLSGALKIVNSIGQQNLYGIGMYGGSGLTLDNSVLSGNAESAILLAGTTGPSAITTSTITGNAAKDVYSAVIQNWSGQPLTASHSILLPNPYQPSSLGFDGLTDDGTNTYSNPAFTKRAAPMIIVPYIDDFNNLGVTQAVASVAQSYGFHLNFAVNTRWVTQDGWTKLAAFQAAGNEIVAHTRTHSDLADLSVLTITYNGPAPTATITINVGNKSIQTFLNGSSVPDLNISMSEHVIATDICTLINAHPGYSCSVPATQYWFDPVNFADVANLNIKAPYVVQADPNRYYNYEINGAKADIQANLPGTSVRSFATPYSSSSTAVENLIQSAGYELNRNGLPESTSSFLLSHFDTYSLAAYWFPESAILSDSMQSVSALVEGLGSVGGIYAVYSHGYDEFTLEQWTAFFANLKAVGGTCMTASEALNYIKTHGSLAQDGTNHFWNVPVQVTPDFTTTSASPTQGAHVTNQ